MGGKTTSTTQSVQIPKEVMDRYNAVNVRAEDAAKQPFQQYGGQFVAGLTPTQQAGLTGTSQAANLAQPYYQAATNLAMAGSEDVGPLTQGQIGYYMNPYTEAVAAPTYQALRQQQGQELSQQQAQAIRSGAAFGDRSGIERANLMRQQALGTAQAMAPIYSQGYQQAVQTAAGQQGVAAQDLARRMQGGQQLAALGTGAQQAALQGAQAQLAAGTAEQQTQQADLTARYQQFLQERGYPFQVSQFLANIAMGTGALSGSTTTTTQPAGFFSDERLKEDAVRIGETDEGLPIYSYRYKGQGGPKQIGLMAQDVEKVHPEAVGLAAAADGHYYKTVDYAKATERPRKEYGGGLDFEGASENWMGGAVQPQSQGLAFSRGGYAPGGVVDPNDIQALLAAQRQSFGPFGQSGLYGAPGAGSGAPGLSSIVPEAKLPVPRLITASGSPQQPRSGFQEAASVGKNISDLYNTGKELRKGFNEVREAFAGKAYGGAIGYAEGGEIDPYELSSDPLGDVVKAGKSEIRELPKPGQPPSAPKSGFGEIADIAKGASSLFSLGSGAVSGLSALAALLPFSDERMKDNVDPVGETYDGQTIYRYNLGDGATQLGLMAQESRKDAVHKDGLGLLHLDYKKATDDAVPFAYGGLVPRQGYQAGGDIADYSAEADLPAMGAVEVSENPRDRFIREMTPHAMRVAEETGLDPRLVIAKSALETGYGRSAPGQNYFGIKSHGRAGGQDLATTEVLDGRPTRVRDSFRSYADMGESASDYANFLRTNPRYRSLLAAPDLASQIEALGRSGYATDPNYASKIRNIASGLEPLREGDLPALSSRETGGEGKVPLGEAVSRGRPGEYAGVPASKASFGDFAREYLPSGVPTSEKFWVPALGFLGSMLASKSPFLGQAIGEGLMGGVSAYTGLEKSSADVEKLKAEAEKIRTEAQVQEFNELYERKWVLGKGWVVVDKRKPFDPGTQITDANLNPLPGIDPKLGAVPVSRDSKDAPGAGTNVLTGAPARQQPSTAPKTETKAEPVRSRPIARDVGTWQATIQAPEDFNPPGQYNIAYGPEEYRQTEAARARPILLEQTNKGSAAYAQLTSLERMMANVEALPDEGFNTIGQFAPQRRAFAEGVNDFMRVLGKEPLFDPNDRAKIEELSKDATRLGGQLASSFGTREPGFIVQQAISATPNIGQSKQAYRLIASGLVEQARYEKDKSSFMDNYFQRFGHLNGAVKLFEDLNPPEKYAARALANSTNKREAGNFVRFMQMENVDPQEKAKAYRDFETRNGAGTAKAVLEISR